MIDQLIKPVDTEKYNYTSWDLTENWFNIFVSESNRIAWNFPMLFAQYGAFFPYDAYIFFRKLFNGEFEF